MIKNGYHIANAALHRNHPVRVDLVGCGGTGSQMLNLLVDLHLTLQSRNHPGLNVNVIDPDTVSSSNIGRQRFFAADIGHNKAMVSVNRINIAYGLNWSACPERYTGRSGDIMITCVDSRKSRREIIRVCGMYDYHIDCGNGYDFGQVAIGNGKDMAWPQQIFPSLFDAVGDDDDDTPSCSLAEAVAKQSMTVNRFAANIAAQLLADLFLAGKINRSGAVYNLKTLEMRPIPLMSVNAAKARNNQ